MEKRIKILILGISGMLGHQVYKYLNNEKICKLSGVGKKDGFFDIDVNNFSELKKILKKLKPNIVINCIGKLKNTNSSVEDIYRTNSLLPKFLEMNSHIMKFKIIHISTDCVFLGTKGSYKEKDFCDAKDHYGISKILGEIKSQNVVNIRTSIIGFETKKRKRGLLEWFFSQKRKIQGYSSAFFSGLTTLELSEILYKYFIKNKKIFNYFLGSVVHISGPKISKFSLLKLISKIFNKKIKIIKSKKIKINRTLNSQKFQKYSGYNKKSWKLMLNTYKEYSKR